MNSNSIVPGEVESPAHEAGYTVDASNSVVLWLRNAQRIARGVGAALALSLAACATTGTASGALTAAPSGPAAGAPTTSPSAALPPVAPPPAAAPRPVAPPPVAPPPVVTAPPPASFVPPAAHGLFHTAAPEEQFVEWEGGRSPNLSRVVVDKTRRKIYLATGTGSVFFLDGGCPPGWDLDLGGVDPSTGPERVFHTVTSRDPARGTFMVMGTASTRAGGRDVGQFDCVKKDAAGVEVDRESLTATVDAVGGAPGTSPGTAPDPFFFRGNPPRSEVGTEKSEGASSSTPVFVEAALADSRPITGPQGNNFAVDADVGFEPVHGDSWAEGAQFGGRFRFAQVPETITTADGGTGDVKGKTFFGFLRGAWNPRIVGEYVRGFLGLGVGVGHAQRLETGPNTDVPAVTGVAGMVDAGIQAGAPNFGVKAGWEGTMGNNDALQTHGPFLGAYGRF